MSKWFPNPQDLGSTFPLSAVEEGLVTSEVLLRAG